MKKINLSDGVVTFPINLVNDHLTLAAEALQRCYVMDWRSKNAISVVTHSYCGLESVINYLGYMFFFDKTSDKYIPENKRDIPLKRMLKNWNNTLPCIDKIELILSHNKVELPALLRNKLLELNLLRNWIIHGFTYEKTMLLIPKNDGSGIYTRIDSEDNVEWSKKFPITKYNLIDELDSSDGEKALRIVLELIKLLSKANTQIFVFVVYWNKIQSFIIADDTNINEIMRDLKDTAT